LGLSLYTYISARLLPLLVVVICLAEWPALRTRWRDLALLVLISVAIFAPEGVYFARHAREMLLRTAAVSVFNPHPNVEGSHDTPLESILNTAGMFFVRGDENRRNNIPHLPIMDPPLALFFVAGLGLAAWRARWEARFRWPLLWLLIGILPSALSHESPNTFRVLAAAPATFVFPALALDRFRRALSWHRLGTVLVAALVIWSVATTFDRYFLVWGRDPRTYWTYDGNLPRLASFVSGQPERLVVFGLDRRSTVEFLDPTTLRDRWYREESAAIPIPGRPSGDVLYVSGPNAALHALAPGMLPGLQTLPHSTGPDGKADFYAFRWPAADVAAFLRTSGPLDGNMAPDFRLVDYTAAYLSGKLTVDLFWQPLRPFGPYDLYVHLMDGKGRQVGQSDRLVWPIDRGSPSGTLLLTQHTFAVPPGSYTAQIGAVHRSVQDRSNLVGGPIGRVVNLPIEAGA
ncbi:MAG: hypothetical protein ACYDAG_05365, partial [Chloroflexota bacterium]